MNSEIESIIAQVTELQQKMQTQTERFLVRSILSNLSALKSLQTDIKSKPEFIEIGVSSEILKPESDYPQLEISILKYQLINTEKKLAAYASQTKDELVYLVWTIGTPFFKIGYSHEHSISGRMSSFATSSPLEAKLIGLMRGTRESEQLLHYMFQIYHHRGEWFNLSLEGIVTLASLFGIDVPEAIYMQDAKSNKSKHVFSKAAN